MKTMIKKEYSAPEICVHDVNIMPIVMGSTLDPDTPTVEVTDEEYHGVFGSRGGGSFFDDED